MKLVQLLKRKCDDVISKNTGIKLLKNISKIIQGKNIDFNDFPTQNY